jgi:hypothetical protein
VAAPSAVLDLIERFDRNVEAYHSGSYNETQARHEFIDPLFMALGWDINNQAGNAEAYKEVVHEYALKIGLDSTAPDYCFRVGGTRKFFVEAKKPSVRVKDDVPAAFQLRRYAWSAKLPLSILTDFEEFAVYDCRVKPVKSDSAATARIMYLTFADYAAKWEDITTVFSRDAVWQGSFDKYAEKTKGKKGTAEVDAAFLMEIEEWRDSLARTIALRNPSLTQRELNFAVQTTIDRIIFLRICEDRGIEDYGRLQGLLNGSGAYPRLLDLFRHADQRYNSGLFHFASERGRAEAPDALTPSLTIDDKALKDILKRLYYPDSPYEFSVLPADILGQVYEQFLGKVIRLTAGHRAVVEDKPEVKKAGGVYYTPTYIVDYIVKNTVGKLLEGSTPTKASTLRILDPACGSGSFLIGAYQYLLDWHRDWYEQHSPEKYRKELYQGAGGVWRLSTSEKKRILLNNIYGVDIDSQAVETTKLSLLLKVLNGETQETINAQLSFLHERALPDLAANIKCGNSLIGPDFYDDQQLGLAGLDDKERYRINVFDWEAEFPQILGKAVPEERRGFDAAIGNPPYLKIEHVEQSDRDYYFSSYATCSRRFDVYGLFLEKAVALLRDQGEFGMIIPSTMLNNLTFAPLRKMLLERTWLRSIVNLGGRVFANVNNDTVILLCRSGAREDGATEVIDVPTYGSSLQGAVSLGVRDFVERATAPGYELELRVTEEVAAVISKMADGNPVVGDLCACFQGFVTGGNDAYLVDDATIESEGLESDRCRLAVFGDEISRYGRPTPRTHVIYLTRNSNLDDWPWVRRHLEPFKAKLEKKREVQMGRQPWYALHWPRVEANFERSEKLLVQAIRNLSLTRRVVATLDRERLYADHTLNVLYTVDDLVSIRAVLAVLNSTLVNWYFRKKHIDINIKGVYLTAVPLPRALTDSSGASTAAPRLAELADSLLSLRTQGVQVRTAEDASRLQRQAESVDRQIDRLVYELYGLSDDQIALVEAV